jgi:phospholipid transport system substrate-binding protein
MMAVSRRVLLVAGLSSALLPRLAWADDDGTSATAPIAALNAALVAIMKAGDATPFLKRYQMLVPVADQVFDLQRIIEVSVGSYWSGLPPAQQQKLLQVFRCFIIATYVANFHSFNGEVSAVSPTTRPVGAQQVVTSMMTKPSGDTLRIDYVMGKSTGSQNGGGQSSGAWTVQDILLDGTISRVAVQRSDFAALLSQGDATRLIASLEQKVSTLSSGAISA